MSDETPAPSELVYIPEPSWSPYLVAFGLAGIVAGLFVWFPYGIIGAVLALVGIVKLFGQISPGVERLPRRQKVTTAVLPAVPPRKPNA